ANAAGQGTSALSPSARLTRHGRSGSRPPTSRWVVLGGLRPLVWSGCPSGRSRGGCRKPPRPGLACLQPVCGVAWLVRGPVARARAALGPVPAHAFFSQAKEAAGERLPRCRGRRAGVLAWVVVLNGR